MATNMDDPLTVADVLTFLSSVVDPDTRFSDLVGIQTVQGDGWDEPVRKSTVGADDIRLENGHLIFETRID